MATSRTSLQVRVISSLIVVALLLVTAFALIQVKSKYDSIRIYNDYRVSIGPIIAQLFIEKSLQAAPDAGPFDAQIEGLLLLLHKQRTADGLTVFRADGQVIASTESGVVPGTTLPASEVFRAEQLTRADTTTVLYNDVQSRQAFVYVILEYPYILKLSFLLSNIPEAISQVSLLLIATAVIVLLISILFGFFLSMSIIGPITILNEATKDIAAGNLDLHVKITTRDELEELSDTFNAMTISLKRMRAVAEDANPLTRLPGNRLLQEEIESRLSRGMKIVVIHADLDNFKAFNDNYGLEKGDEAIKLTAEVIKEAIEEAGTRSDFLSHIGGDDFVLVATPEKDTALAELAIRLFDERIRTLYSAGDLERGYIMAKGRDDQVKKYPIMTISMAGVSNQNRPLKSYAEVTNIATDVKKKAKSVMKSVYILDQRTT